jgi:hypothetical protein
LSNSGFTKWDGLAAKPDIALECNVVRHRNIFLAFARRLLRTG